MTIKLQYAKPARIGPLFRHSQASSNRGRHRAAKLPIRLSGNILSTYRPGGSKYLTTRPRSLISYLIEKSKSVANYDELASRVKLTAEFLSSLKDEQTRSRGVDIDWRQMSTEFQERIRQAISAGTLPSFGNQEDAIVVVSDLAAYDVLCRLSAEPVSAVNSGEALVNDMVERAKAGLPPDRPYFRRDWATPTEFLLDAYGHLLSSNPKENFLYQDQLSWVHPSKNKLSKILGDDHSYGSEAWGENLMQSLRNYFASRGGAKALAEVVPTKKQRNDKRFQEMGLSPEDMADKNKRSAASFLRL